VFLFCVVRVVRVLVLCCDSGAGSCFVLTVVRVLVLCCDSGKRGKKVSKVLT
jgi:hypothetical protein